MNINPHKIILVDNNKDVVSILAGTFALNGYEVHKTYAAEECLNKIKELEGIVDVIFVDGKIAADRATMLIVNVKRVNSKIPIVVLAEDETNKTRVLEYGADDFATKPVSANTIVAKVNNVLLKKNKLQSFNT
ncbi:response regulator transcription factor [Nitrososphaera sp. AFS]|uniref:response regulator transcription factor n=1 Tax=Nitrososphaera sp. AFS TaxID=2301191 RepID=UPI0013923C1B|nr:response regulator [Nitrososphaera sp. AFS]NAL78908.1 response regulator [Nitrososphaera sp. AFS]